MIYTVGPGEEVPGPGGEAFRGIRAEMGAEWEGEWFFFEEMLEEGADRGREWWGGGLTLPLVWEDEDWSRIPETSQHYCFIIQKT